MKAFGHHSQFVKVIKPVVCNQVDPDGKFFSQLDGFS